jgi:hypothetical protein
VAGRNPTEAVKAFAEPIQRALTCFAHGKVTADSYDPATEGVLRFNRSEDVPLEGGKVAVSITMRYQIVRARTIATPTKPWKVSTTGWIYAVTRQDGTKIVDFHWHPAITPLIPFPHLHAPSEPDKRHFPTGRVLIEDVLVLAVECGAQPRDSAKWDKVREANVGNFGKAATWGTRLLPNP